MWYFLPTSLKQHLMKNQTKKKFLPVGNFCLKIIYLKIFLTSLKTSSYLFVCFIYLLILFIINIPFPWQWNYVAVFPWTIIFHLCSLVFLWIHTCHLLIYAFSRRFYPKRLTLHSSYSFTFYQLLLSLGIEPMILALLAPCSTIWATGKLLMALLAGQNCFYSLFWHIDAFTVYRAVLFHYRPTYFPAENLTEYKWPPDDTGEYYMLQEQVSEYLGVTSFKRKYPGMNNKRLNCLQGKLNWEVFTLLVK